jgi:hypothetical protein
MTEAEASKLWCPFARTVVKAQTDKSITLASKNREFGSGKADPDCFCIASRCMAWQPHTMVIEGQRHGHCGLMASHR